MPARPMPAPLQTIDLRQWVRSADRLSGRVDVVDLARWAEGAPHWEPRPEDPAPALDWQAHIESRPVVGGGEAVWLHLTFQGWVPQECQRCLSAYLERIEVDRWFRFVADEASAEAEDDEVEEDLLVWSPRFNLLELIEDELLLGVPLVPMHDVCPDMPPLQSPLAGSDRTDQRPHPFAVLEALKAEGSAPRRRSGEGS